MSSILLLLDRNLRHLLAQSLGSQYQLLMPTDDWRSSDPETLPEAEGKQKPSGDPDKKKQASLSPPSERVLNPERSVSSPSLGWGELVSSWHPLLFPDIRFDLCILDEVALDRFGSHLQLRKAVETPVFLPFLLVSSSLGLPHLSPEDRDGCSPGYPSTLNSLRLQVDDLIRNPIDPWELQFRVETLLERRRLSSKLHKVQRSDGRDSPLTIISPSPLPLELIVRESSYLTSLMNVMPDIVCFKDGNGRWLEANQAMLQAFQLDRVDYRGLLDSQLAELSPFYRDTLLMGEQNDAETWNKAELSRNEEVIPCPDGRAKIYDVIKVPLFNPDRSRKGLVVLGRDITERKQSQDELVRLAAIVESSDDAIISNTLEGIVLSWNAGAQQIYGYSATEMKGQSISILMMPDRPSELSQILTSIQAGGSIDHYETVHLRKDGKQIDVSLTISPIKDASGLVTGVSAIARDISDRRRVETALEQLRHQTELILRSVGDGICGLNNQGKITFVNPAAARMTGYEVKELIDQPLHQSLHHATHDRQPIPCENCQILATLKDGLPRQVTDEVFWRRDGTCFPVEYVVTPIREQGEIIGVVVSFKDITERQAVERMKDEFISVVSHELRTPLTSIHGALGLLNSGLLDTHPQRAKRMLEIAVANTDRLVRLINDILDLERMESGQSSLKHTCNIADLMDQAVDEMRAMAERANVALAMTSIEALVWGNPDHLIQALTNLLSNAIKFSPPEATVWLTAGKRVRDEDLLEEAESSSCDRLSYTPSYASVEVLLSVRDEGRGIPPDKLETIFERFQQVDASDSRQKGGTGLGLAICRSIVLQHGGRIWVESILGQGSTFFLTLPLVSDEQWTIEAEVQEEPGVDSVQGARKGDVKLSAADRSTSFHRPQSHCSTQSHSDEN